VSRCDILGNLFLQQQISDQFLQPIEIILQLLQPLGLIGTQAAAFPLLAVAALFGRPRFSAGRKCTLALSLHHLDLSQLRDDLLRS
jgi:hypothetical protein